MKKIVMATLAVATLGLAACGQEAKAEGTAATVDMTPFVGVERETSADTTTMYLGADLSAGALDLTLQVDMEGKSDNRGDVTNLNIDGSYAVTESVSLYTENDLNSDFERTETKVGVKYAF